MSLHNDLLKQARRMVFNEPRRPLQASLRRSVSTAYYALFHLLIHESSKSLVKGSDREALRSCLARAYRHVDMKDVCGSFANNRVSPKLVVGLNGLNLQPELIRLADAFVQLQQARHEADYNVGQRFTRSEVLDLLEQAEQAFKDWVVIRSSLQADVFLVALLAQKKMQG